jgi:hypothetical protein
LISLVLNRGPKLLKSWAAGKESNAGKDGITIWILRLIDSLGVPGKNGGYFYCNNSGAQSGPEYQSLSKAEPTTASKTIGTHQ